jgi:hypothetical protein
MTRTDRYLGPVLGQAQQMELAMFMLPIDICLPEI